jgi:hypothetical protein
MEVVEEPNPARFARCPFPGKEGAEDKTREQIGSAMSGSPFLSREGGWGVRFFAYTATIRCRHFTTPITEELSHE